MRYFQKTCEGKCVSRTYPCPERPCRPEHHEKWCHLKQACTYERTEETKCCREILCKDGTCKYSNQMCPGESCEEMNWEGSKTCKNEAKCYLYNHRCDGQNYCKEGTDEEGCPGTVGDDLLPIKIIGGVLGSLAGLALLYCCYKFDPLGNLQQENVNQMIRDAEEAESLRAETTASAPRYTEPAGEPPPSQAPSTAPPMQSLQDESAREQPPIDEGRTPPAPPDKTAPPPSYEDVMQRTLHQHP